MKDGAVLVESLQDLGGHRHEESKDKHGGASRLQDQERALLHESFAVGGAGEDDEGLQPEVHDGDRAIAEQGQDSGDCELHPDLVAFVEGPRKEAEPLSEVMIRELDIKNKRWEEHVSDLSDIQSQNLTMAVPLKSRHVAEITKALSYFYAKLKSLNLPLHRVHSDRAKEFVSKSFATWISQRDVMHTTTAGDEHQGCARAEGEIGYLKKPCSRPSHFHKLGGAPLAFGPSTCGRMSLPIPASTGWCLRPTGFALWGFGNEQGQAVAFGQASTSHAEGDPLRTST